MAGAVAALQQLLAHHPLVPAGRIEIGREQITVRLHGGFGDFEYWREALGVDHNDVCLNDYLGGTNLRAVTRVNDITVVLIGFSDTLPKAQAEVKAA
ncbi:hypothetical protein [Streptomyces sp. cg35]|uniref:hypothetical protein n=1 Tax=Streptomyces sp. cg35 TaxID=3421650 RepID=UPI003D176581